jgi:hypothetical protein
VELLELLELLEITITLLTTICTIGTLTPPKSCIAVVLSHIWMLTPSYFLLTKINNRPPKDENQLEEYLDNDLESLLTDDVSESAKYWAEDEEYFLEKETEEENWLDAFTGDGNLVEESKREEISVVTDD